MKNKSNLIKLLTLSILLSLFSGCATASMYDEDLDGVKNNKDICLGTPKNVTVNKYGCALDTDKDGVLNIYDKCPNSLFTDIVNSTGCLVNK